MVKWKPRAVSGMVEDGPVGKSSPTVRNQLPGNCNPKTQVQKYDWALPNGANQEIIYSIYSRKMIPE